MTADVLVQIQPPGSRVDDDRPVRKPLEDQAAFYVGKPRPPILQRAIDANDASFTALTDVFHGLESEVADIVARYDGERDRLRKLWAGAPLGSMGLLAPASAPARAR
jgi:hypothetical protein